eukprot:CAMPEP_0196815736 /NCGR_PEP_ID=MMETSP1362-20130617/51573_1 /TAXON_ID=163516 /ORGANISM="Leptocylindrus danicus, Strain CCMP1856" /LENGTH=242 /DNA_ID=CAMNT_0042192807 /DNA_START=99 /DNA_END=824 /DNA_ORIENTATION=+
MAVKGSTKRGKVTFPAKLHQILANPDYAHIVSWLPGGKTWKIHSASELEDKIIPKYFESMTKRASFTRQMSGWGFIRKNAAGPDRGSYSHQFFLKDRPELCKLMRRHSRRNVKSVCRVMADAPAPAYDHKHESSSSYYPGSSLTLPLARDHNFTNKPYVPASPCRMISDVSLSQYDDFPQRESSTVDLSHSFSCNISKFDKFGNLDRDACAVHVSELSDGDPLEPFPVEQDIASPSRRSTNW